MKVYYFDSSALLAVMFQQGPFKELRKIMESNHEILSSALIEAEVLATVRRENTELAFANSFLERISLVFIERSLMPELQTLLQKQFCRGADSFHLATALYLDPKATEITFVTLDQNQKRGAKSLGFRCY